MIALELALLFITVALCVPASVLLVQVVASLFDRLGSLEAGLRRPRLAVLVPAHDEESGIVATIDALRPQLMPGDRLLVIADNCTDRTASLAASAGAQVVERFDSQRRGKGYALDHGMRHLSTDPPEVVVMIDADCHTALFCLDRLSRMVESTQGPVQALYLMHSPSGAGLSTRIGEFAWIVKNQVRPSGGRAIGSACQLMGTGMAVPWSLLRDAPLASGNIVEDLQLGIDLARAGRPPRFCPQAQVSSVFPASSEGLQIQRTRWEHGHISTLLSQGPWLLASGLRQRRWSVVGMALDLCVPPLSAFVLMVCAACFACGIWALASGRFLPLCIALTAAAFVFIAIVLAWWRYARTVIRPREWLTLPLFVVAKVPLYLRALVNRQTAWVRTRRDGR